MNELEYQIRRFHSFLWASGGCYSDFYIHNIDESCWMKNAWPVEAKASGGRNYRGDYVDQNFDTYSVEYTFADISKARELLDYQPKVSVREGTQQFYGWFVSAIETAAKAGQTPDQALAGFKPPEKFSKYNMQRAKANVDVIFKEVGK